MCDVQRPIYILYIYIIYIIYIFIASGRLFSQSGDHHIPIVAQSNTDAHIQLTTKNDEGKNIYLINNIYYILYRA